MIKEKRQYNGDHIPYMPDTGCELAPKCLECPEEKCKHDIPVKERHQSKSSIKRIRNKEIIKLWKEGKTAKELAVLFNLSIHSIWKIIREGIKENNG